MKDKVRTANWSGILLRTAVVLLLLVQISTCIISGRYARYTTSISFQDGARVAAYVFELNNKEKQYIDISKISKPGDSQTYTFELTNTKNQRTSEVKEKYQLTLELIGSLPLTCKLSKDNETLEAEGISKTVSGKEYTFEASEATTHTYTLTVEWPEDKNDWEYANAGLAELVLHVKAEQVN